MDIFRGASAVVNAARLGVGLIVGFSEENQFNLELRTLKANFTARANYKMRKVFIDCDTAGVVLESEEMERDTSYAADVEVKSNSTSTATGI